jgi:hypothetical protein
MFASRPPKTTAEIEKSFREFRNVLNLPEKMLLRFTYEEIDIIWENPDLRKLVNIVDWRAIAAHFHHSAQPSHRKLLHKFASHLGKIHTSELYDRDLDWITVDVATTCPKAFANLVHANSLTLHNATNFTTLIEKHNYDQNVLKVLINNRPLALKYAYSLAFKKLSCLSLFLTSEAYYEFSSLEIGALAKQHNIYDTKWELATPEFEKKLNNYKTITNNLNWYSGMEKQEIRQAIVEAHFAAADEIISYLKPQTIILRIIALSIDSIRAKLSTSQLKEIIEHDSEEELQASLSFCENPLVKEIIMIHLWQMTGDEKYKTAAMLAEEKAADEAYAQSENSFDLATLTSMSPQQMLNEMKKNAELAWQVWKKPKLRNEILPSDWIKLIDHH